MYALVDLFQIRAWSAVTSNVATCELSGNNGLPTPSSVRSLPQRAQHSNIDHACMLRGLSDTLAVRAMSGKINNFFV